MKAIAGLGVTLPQGHAPKEKVEGGAELAFELLLQACPQPPPPAPSAALALPFLTLALPLENAEGGSQEAPTECSGPEEEDEAKDGEATPQETSVSELLCGIVRALSGPPRSATLWQSSSTRAYAMATNEDRSRPMPSPSPTLGGATVMEKTPAPIEERRPSRAEAQGSSFLEGEATSTPLSSSSAAEDLLLDTKAKGNFVFTGTGTGTGEKSTPQPIETLQGITLSSTPSEAGREATPSLTTTFSSSSLSPTLSAGSGSKNEQDWADENPASSESLEGSAQNPFVGESFERQEVQAPGEGKAAPRSAESMRQLVEDLRAQGAIVEPSSGDDWFELQHPDLGRIRLQIRLLESGFEMRAMTTGFLSAMALRAQEGALRSLVEKHGFTMRGLRTRVEAQNFTDSKPATSPRKEK